MRFVESADLRILAKLPVATALAWLLPPRCWRLAARLSAGQQMQLAAKITQFVGAAPRTAAAAIARRHRAELSLDQLAYLRCHAPWGWRPMLTLDGMEHLSAARAKGKGAILWIAPTISGPLVSKMTLHAHGVPVHHLSHPLHGFSSSSRLGRAFLNPLRTRIEDRYLRERVMLGEHNQAQAALRRLTGLLRQGEVVSITVGARGSRVASARFGQGWFRVANGASALAERTGAALLPTIAWRGETGGYVTTIGAPIPSSGGLAEIAAALARRLEEFAVRHPEQLQWAHGCLVTSAGQSPIDAETREAPAVAGGAGP